MTAEEKHPVLLECLHDGVLCLVLNRPGRRNAFSPELYEQLLLSLEAASNDSDVGAVVLSGAQGNFSAGGDVARMAKAGENPISVEARATGLRQRSRIGELLHTMPKPTIALLQGHVVGSALSIASACDLRYADTTVRLKTGFIKVGLAGDHGGHYFLPRLIGMAKARELYMTSRTVTAHEAVSIGLVNAVFEPSQMQDEVMALAREMANESRNAMAYLKRNLNDGLRLALADVLENESVRHARCTEHPDHHEATRAFVEKRASQFKNR